LTKNLARDTENGEVNIDAGRSLSDVARLDTMITGVDAATMPPTTAAAP
jgi:hypothetical protein